MSKMQPGRYGEGTDTTATRQAVVLRKAIRLAWAGGVDREISYPNGPENELLNDREVDDIIREAQA